MHCAGGFMVDEELLLAYLSTRVGTEDEVIGMPLSLTRRLLREAREGRGHAQMDCDPQ